MTKIFKRAAALLLGAVLLLGCTLPTLAAANATEGQESDASLVFINRKTDTTGLKVNKTVENPNGEESTGTAFTFHLKLGGKLASGEVYRYFNAKEQEVYQYYNPATKDYYALTKSEYEAHPDKASLSPMEWKTDRNGTFMLAHGESVLFTGAAMGDRYEIEEEAEEGFVQTLPAGGAAAEGTVSQAITQVDFKNRYQPDEPTDGDYANIHISKNILLPAGYEFYGNDSFTFTVTLDGEPLEEAEYTVYTSSGSARLRTGKTTADGQLTLNGGEEAIIEEIPVEALCQVTEAQTEGWWSVGDSVQNARIINSDHYFNFTNRSASFAVEKEMGDGSASGMPFTFTLLKENGAVWAGASYYIYNSDNTLADSRLYATGNDGSFVLYAGEKALFTGIPEGTVFSVREQAASGYVQVVPSSSSGYVNEAVTASVKNLAFVNKVESREGELSVTKRVTSTSDQAIPDAEFTFKLMKADGTPVKNAVYAKGDSTYKTDANGIFTMKANETISFTKLMQDEEYIIEELGVAEGNGYNKSEFIPVEGWSQRGTLTAAGIGFMFTNNYETSREVQIVKVDKDSLAKLEKAVFTVEKMTDVDTVDTYYSPVDVTTGEDGTVRFTVPVPGLYRLTEKEAPDNYVKLETAILFDTETEKTEGAYSVKVIYPLGKKTTVVTVLNKKTETPTETTSETEPTSEGETTITPDPTKTPEPTTGSGGGGNKPQTGDTSNPGLWIALIVACITAVVVVIVVLGRKKKGQEK